MDIFLSLLFLIVGAAAFLIYRRGIRDGVRLAKNQDVSSVFMQKEKKAEKEKENDFLNQYSELMSYDFDKAGENIE